MWFLIGIPIGIVSAIKRGSFWDRAGMLFALIGVSVPVFWLGTTAPVLLLVQARVAPRPGSRSGRTIWHRPQGKFILPWITLSITSAAFYARMIRGNLIETMSEDYIRTARAKGLPERRVIFKHGLRGALTPVVTMLGLDLGALLGGAFITETLFGLPGIGQMAVQSIGTQDFPEVMGVTILGAMFIAVANLVVDIVYAFLDPRVRYT